VLGVFWPTPRLEGEAARDGRPLPDRVQRFADARATRVGLRVLGLLMAVVTVAVAAIGPISAGLAGLADLRPEPGVVAVVCTLLGSTAFDGLSRTRWWTDLTLDLDFGTADWKMNLVLVSTSAIALFRGRGTLRAQYLLLTTMVFYTLSGIALLVGT
jgi:hypothetical protein